VSNPTTQKYELDHLGRELCPYCYNPLPSDSIARELHLIRHVLLNINDTLEYIADGT